MITKVFKRGANLPILLHLNVARFELQVVCLVNAEGHFKFRFRRKSDPKALLPGMALLNKLGSQFRILSR